MSLVLYDELDNKRIKSLYRTYVTQEIGNLNILLKQSFQENGVSGCLWHSSTILSKYLHHNQNLIRSRSIIELGAGTGLAGIVASKLGGLSVITDHENHISVAQENCKLNNIPITNCLALNCGSDAHKLLSDHGLKHPDVIIGSCYIEDSFHGYWTLYLIYPLHIPK